MSRKTVELRNKARQGGWTPDAISAILPNRSVKGQGKMQRRVSTTDDKGNVSITMQPGINTGKVCTMHMKTEKRNRLEKQLNR